MMRQAGTRTTKCFILLLGSGVLLQAVGCTIFELPGPQALADFAVGFAREVLAAYFL